MSFSQRIESLPSTSILTIRRLKNLDIKTYWDLLHYFPFRYEDHSIVSSIQHLQEGEKVTVKGTVVWAKNEFTRRGLKIQKVILADDTGKITLTWYNQPYLIRLLSPGTHLAASGEIKKYGATLTMEPKEYDVLKTIDQETIHTGRLVPIYPEKKGLSSRTLREKIFFILKDYTATDGHAMQEIFPEEIIRFNDLIEESVAYQNIHFPKSKELAKKARQRLAFDELFIIQFAARLVRQEWEKEAVGNRIQTKPYEPQLNAFMRNLPFELTNAQKKVLREILLDIFKKYPMNRFLQGDVGSGKTVVAAIVAYLAFLNRFRTLFMAPTTILAQQHFQTLTYLFKNYPVSIALQTGARKTKNLDKNHIVVGTHALLSQKFLMRNVGFVVIDEQHRFGVRQRALLKAKGINPHLLTMTATPIPRTVALTLYGELDISHLDEMPKGRIPVQTFLVPKEKRRAAYDWITKKVKQESAQVFIVCPLIEQSDHETMQSVKAAKIEYEYLSRKIFPDFKVELLHGKLKTKEKEEIMNNFARGALHILVTTSVVEVGIDIPQATIMIVEGAERFGLAQLHQLRGRIGRSTKQSYCFLFTEKEDPHIVRRLNYFSRNTNGMRIAEYDLEVRGPGEIYGTRQHGYLDLKIATFADYPMIEKTKNAVEYLLKKYKLSAFPALKKRVNEYQIEQVTRD